MRSVVWFRNDLRVLDNPALHNACLASDEVIGVFIITEEQWMNHDDAKCKISFILRAVESLKKSLEKINIPLVTIDAGDFKSSETELFSFCEKNEIANLYFNCEYQVNELKRDRQIYKNFKEKNIGVFNYHDQVVHVPGSLKTKAGGDFSVYSPFKRKWFEELREDQLKILEIPKKQEELKLNSINLSDYQSKYSSDIDDLWFVSEDYAHQMVNSFLKTRGDAYKDDRNFPAIDGCSKISPYLNIGVVSSKWCLVKAREHNNNQLEEGSRGIVHWVSEILWREFYRHIMYNFPRVSMNKAFLAYTEELEWSEDQESFDRWMNARTGIPIVDAGIEEMKQTGWMHNRLRMIVAMFLSKNLLIDWRKGEKFFMQHLIDGDLASNNGGWQWSASTGTDAAPYFRIMNPETQSLKFDPQGEYIKKWLPRLKDCPVSEIHMPSNPEKYGYVKPIVDLKQSRQAAIDAFGNLKKN